MCRWSQIKNKIKIMYDYLPWPTNASIFYPVLLIFESVQGHSNSDRFADSLQQEEKKNKLWCMCVIINHQEDIKSVSEWRRQIQYICSTGA